MMKLVFDRREEEEAEVLQLAREEWDKVYGPPRRPPAVARIDKDISKESQNEKTEQAMLRKRRSEIQALLDEHAGNVEEKDADELSGWAACHVDEYNFQTEKRQKRVVDACLGGLD